MRLTYLLFALSLGLSACGYGPQRSSDQQSRLSTTEELGQESPCTLRECGPRPMAPNFLCPDGKTTAGPTGICERNPKTQVCSWGFVFCPSEIR